MKLPGLWLGGFLCATLLAWQVSYYFLFNIYEWQWDPELEEYVRPEGLVRRWTKEGWGITHYGKHDIVGIPDIRKVVGPIISLWGDSFIEAYQVNDDHKIFAYAQTICARDFGIALTAATLGTSGRNASDTYYLLPKYERIFASKFHFIIFHNLGDIVPDEKTFISKPTFAFVRRPPPSVGGWGQRLAFIRPEFIFIPLREFIDDVKAGNSLRLGFIPRSATSSASAIAATGEAEVAPITAADAPVEAWRFALKALARQAKAPLVFVYARPLPLPRNGKILYENQEQHMVDRFAQITKDVGVDFIDVSPKFIELFDKENLFPAGFHNGNFGEGHYNAHGQRVIAESICAYIGKHRDGFHAN